MGIAAHALKGKWEMRSLRPYIWRKPSQHLKKKHWLCSEIHSPILSPAMLEHEASPKRSVPHAVVCVCWGGGVVDELNRTDDTEVKLVTVSGTVASTVRSSLYTDVGFPFKEDHNCPPPSLYLL